MGYNSRNAAFLAVKRALEARLAERDAEADKWVARQDALLDEALRVANEIMNKQHYATSGGKIVQKYDEETDTYIDVYDDAPRLAAADRLIKISESRRKMHGRDAPAQSKVSQEVSGTIGYVVNATPEELEQL